MMATMEAFIKKNNLVNFRCVNLEGEKTLKKEPRGTGDDYYTYVRKYKFQAVFVMPTESSHMVISIVTTDCAIGIFVDPYQADGKTIDKSLSFRVVANDGFCLQLV